MPKIRRPLLGYRVFVFLGNPPTFPVPVRKERMKKTKLQDYRRQVETYFEMEYSDLPLEQVLFRLRELYSEKVGKVVRLHHKLKKPPADAAAYAMRILRGPCRSLIVGQTEER